LYPICWRLQKSTELRVSCNLYKVRCQTSVQTHRRGFSIVSVSDSSIWRKWDAVLANPSSKEFYKNRYAHPSQKKKKHWSIHSMNLLIFQFSSHFSDANMDMELISKIWMFTTVKKTDLPFLDMNSDSYSSDKWFSKTKCSTFYPQARTTRNLSTGIMCLQLANQKQILNTNFVTPHEKFFLVKQYFLNELFLV